MGVKMSRQLGSPFKLVNQDNYSPIKLPLSSVPRRRTNTLLEVRRCQTIGPVTNGYNRAGVD